MTLIGTDRIQPIGKRLPRVHRVRVVFHEPIDPAAFIARVEAGGGAGKARREITEAVMDRIAADSPQPRVAAYNERPSDDDDPTS